MTCQLIYFSLRKTSYIVSCTTFGLLIYESIKIILKHMVKTLSIVGKSKCNIVVFLLNEP